MAKPSDLKIFLESSLNEIFKATVSDILDSVDRTLSEYQGTIHRIESENEGLKRLLLAQSRTDSASRDIREQDGIEKFSSSEWNDYTIDSQQGTFKMSICSSDKKSFRRKQKDKTRESISSSNFLLQTDHMVKEQCVSTAEVGMTKENLLSVKTEPGLDESGAIDLSQPSSLLNLTMKPMKTESTEVNLNSPDAYAPMPPSTGLEQDSRGNDSEVKVTIISDTNMQDGQSIKTEEEQNALSEYGDNDNLFLKHELSQCGKTYTDQSSLKKHLKMHASKEQKAQSEGSTSDTETNRPSASEALSDTDRS
ncbi:hypothetical protein PBY51_023538 [Eleginops maclovinus]|uniref:C2H2-type domain-containing protein n=1 Tax=Eleginops maclovinus TaxID=56733 RepID=A0AAN7WUJ4_ELEMC|nr:hypothetical protein PBY51_023538 [Eleginops maclovinus]